MANFQTVNFYDAPWGEPTNVIAEYKGKFYDIRDGWGKHEGWTNNFVAVPIDEEECSDCLECSEAEMRESYGDDDVAGIFDALNKAAQ